MRRYDFNRTKYGSRLLIDLGRMESLPNYNLSREPHCITFYEILFITEGSGTFWLDGRPVAVAPRQIIFCAPYQSRQWQLHDASLKGVSLFFEQEFMSGFFQDALFMQQLAYFNPLSERSALQLDEEAYAKCLGLLQELEQELHSLQADSSHIFRSLLYYLLILLNRQFAAQQQQGAQSQKQQLYKAFRQLLETHLSRWHRVQDYARHLQLSTAYLSRLVQEASGEPAAALIRRRLVLEAKRQLRYSPHTIAEIGYALGFSDASNFKRFFKKAEGCTPKEFRSRPNDQ